MFSAIDAARVAIYVRHNGQRCLSCGDEYSVSGGFVEIDNGRALQTVTCETCAASWRDVYTLTDVNEFEPPQGGMNE